VSCGAQYGVKAGRVDIVELLLSAGADPRQGADTDVGSPLVMAERLPESPEKNYILRQLTKQVSLIQAQEVVRARPAPPTPQLLSLSPAPTHGFFVLRVSCRVVCRMNVCVMNADHQTSPRQLLANKLEEAKERRHFTERMLKAREEEITKLDSQVTSLSPFHSLHAPFLRLLI
jgi:hypothetical protein